MAEKDGDSLSRWQLAWLKRHETELIGRMATMDIVDWLTQKRWMDPGTVLCHRIKAETVPNKRARLLLQFICSSSSECFWGFQKALSETGCVDLAVSRDDDRAVVDSCSDEELTEARPASVVKLNRELKARYRGLRMRSLSGVAGSIPVSLDDIRVNICLLSADKLSALCGRPGQYVPLSVGRLKEKAPSVVELENVFENDEHGRIQTSGIAGSGKSTAFLLKAPHEWAKDNAPRGRRPFWQRVTLFFRGDLANRR